MYPLLTYKITLLDATCNLSMPDPVEPKEEWFIFWESRDPFWNNDWLALWTGLIHFEAPWNIMTVGEYLKNFAVSFINFLISNYDTVSDGNLVSSYLKAKSLYKSHTTLKL